MDDGFTNLRKASFTHADGFGYEITCFEDGTEILYFECKDYDHPISEKNRKQKERLWLTTGFDITICEEVLKLRKLQLEDDKNGNNP